MSKIEVTLQTPMCFPGGIAGAASRITGAMAKGVAAMTMDEEYQQKRREAMNKQPSSLREGLARGGRGLVSVRKDTFHSCFQAHTFQVMTSHSIMEQINFKYEY